MIQVFNFYTNTVHTASAQYSLPMLRVSNMLLDASMMVRFARSATPFCYGVRGHENCCFMPQFFANALNALFLYSPPLSERNTFTFSPS